MLWIEKLVWESCIAALYWSASSAGRRLAVLWHSWDIHGTHPDTGNVQLPLLRPCRVPPAEEGLDTPERPMGASCSCDTSLPTSKLMSSNKCNPPTENLDKHRSQPSTNCGKRSHGHCVGQLGVKEMASPFCSFTGHLPISLTLPCLWTNSATPWLPPACHCPEAPLRSSARWRDQHCTLRPGDSIPPSDRTALSCYRHHSPSHFVCSDALFCILMSESSQNSRGFSRRR